MNKKYFIFLVRGRLNMMKNLLVSVIIPAYNAETYISDCLESVFRQDYKNLEVIIVNDGSKDKTKETIENYIRENRYNAIVINKLNEGVSSARNAGLKVANGDYICFLDSDDALAVNFVSLLIHEMKNSNSDMVVCRRQNVNSKMQKNNAAVIRCNDKYEAKIISSNNAIKMLLNQEITGSSCDKMFCKEIVKSNEFPLGIKYNEDKYFTFLCMLNSKQISLIDTTPYICLSRNDSARHGVKLDDTDYIKVAEMINDKLKNCELSEIAEIHLITMIVYKIRTMMRLNESNFNKKKMFKKIRNKLNQYNTKDLKINRRLRIEIIMIECGYIVYNLFVRVADAILK